MRIERLAQDNRRTQGTERRAWYRRHSPEHLRAVESLIEEALAARDQGRRHARWWWEPGVYGTAAGTPRAGEPRWRDAGGPGRTGHGAGA